MCVFVLTIAKCVYIVQLHYITKAQAIEHKCARTSSIIKEKFCYICAVRGK